MFRTVFPELMTDDGLNRMAKTVGVEITQQPVSIEHQQPQEQQQIAQHRGLNIKRFIIIVVVLLFARLLQTILSYF